MSLGSMEVASAIDAATQKKTHALGMSTLMISNEEIEDIVNKS